MAGMAELGLVRGATEPSFQDRYPEGRERLLALAEKPSPSNPPPVAPRPPKMGLRDVRTGSNGKLRTGPPPPSSRNLVRPSPIYASEQSLPDRLSQALKGLSSSLRPSSQNSGASSFGRQSGASGGSVAADDVVYYPSGNAPNRPKAAQTTTNGHTSDDEVLLPPSSPPPPIPPKFNHGINSLDQLRQLYKSAPDFHHLNGQRSPSPAQETSNQADVRSPVESHYANIDELRLLSGIKPTPVKLPAVMNSQETGGNSPTDSGYRSVPRHVYQEALSPARGTLVIIEDSPVQSKTDQNDTKFGSGELSTELSYPSTTHSSGDSASKRQHRAMERSPEKVTPRKDGTPQRNASFDTINTNVSLPEEFSLDRCPKLVELERVPWNEKDVVTVLQRGRTKDFVHRIAVDVVPRLTYLLQRPLLRISRQMQRLSVRFGKCCKEDVAAAVRIVLPESLSDSALKAGIQATSLYAMSVLESLKQSKSRRAGLRFSVGKFHRWLCDAQISPCVHEQASVFLTAVCECILEDLVLQTLPNPRSSSAAGVSPDSSLEDCMLTSESLDLSLVNNGEFWGLLQPYEHLISSRTANGVLCLPNSVSVGVPNTRSRRMGVTSAEASCRVKTNGTIVKNLEQCFLATCVGSVPELGELIGRVVQHQLSTSTSSLNTLAASGSPSSPKFSWSLEALQTLYYYMRCSQLEGTHSYGAPAISLAHERPYLVLPPLVDWLRVSQAHCDHRSSCIVDSDDVAQAARLLLPALDCPPRVYRCPEPALSSCISRHKQMLAFQLLSTGRDELVPQAVSLLGPLKLNTPNEHGLTALMQACLRGDEPTVHLLLDSGADINAHVPVNPNAERTPNLLLSLAGWTPINFAVCQRNLPLCQALIERCADVHNEHMLTETPLQLAAMSGHYDIASRLLACGADPFHSTINTSEEGYGFKQRGSPCAIVLSASHGHRSLLQLMLSRGHRGRSEEVLSLEDFLAEGNGNSSRGNRSPESVSNSQCSPSAAQLLPGLKLSKAQQKSLQEAMYYAAECGHLDITMDLRNLGISWNAHIWTQALSTAHELRRKGLVQLLLADFVSRDRRLLDEIGNEFIDDGLPLLFDILRHSRTEATTTQVAAILSQLYGAEKPELEVEEMYENCQAAIDPKFVNNPELSDVQFTVEQQIFYAHRIVLVNASEKFRQMLLNNNENCNGQPIEVKDVAYEVFELMMNYLYRNRLSQDRPVSLPELLQLLSVARQFAVVPLARLCQVRISKLIDLENCLEVYKFAVAERASNLVSYTEGFLLHNLPQLLSETESPVAEGLRRMLHYSGRKQVDLCAGLVTTLSARLESRLNATRR